MFFSSILRHKYFSLLAMTALSYAAACSVAPPPAPLIEARDAYQKAERDPNISANAAVALHDARQTLNQAEQEWQQRLDREEVEHLAYLTQQRVRVAQSLAERNMAEKEIERLGEERQKAILEARERDAQRSRNQAEARLQEAQRAQREAALAQSQAKEAQELALARQREAEAAQKAAAATRAEAEAARKREQEAAAKNKDLQRQLAELQAKQTERGLVLTLGDVLFEFDKAELRAGALKNLYPLVTFLKEYPSRLVAIEGHTDSVGAESYNLDLSRRRTAAVRDFLVENGIMETRISARGFGESYPVAANNTEAGRQMNRRVEIIIANETPL